MYVMQIFGIEAVSCLLARGGLQPPSRTSAMRIADAARLPEKAWVESRMSVVRHKT